MRRKSDFLLDALYIFVLCSFALAQPLFDLLSRNAEFFVVRRSEPMDVILLVVILSIALPLPVVLVEGVAGLCGRRVRKRVHGVATACLVAAIALQMLKRAGDLPGVLLVVGAVILGVIVAVGTLRFSPMRTFLTVLSPTVLLFPGLFLFRPAVFKVVFPQENIVVDAAKIKANIPIVMVIFDELPVTSLMDEQRQIDPIRYPHFAALARDATWFRNATTVADFTTEAVPAILTGRYPDPGRHPTATDHPYNIFTLLGKGYNLKVSEAVTQLCPNQLCERTQESLARRLRSLLSDLSIVYLHILLPADLSATLPSVTQNWMDFAADLWRKGERRDRNRQFITFINDIQAEEQTSFHFLHTLLPHPPYDYLPSGKKYNADVNIFGLDRQPPGKWSEAEYHWAAIQDYQRHLLQVGYVDTLLGTLLSHLQTIGLYDRSLIVITADHGVSFLPGDQRRKLTQTNFQDIMSVPLFIKAPNQHEGGIDDRNVETIDIVPTIADILGIHIPWPVDGRSARTRTASERREKVIHLHFRSPTEQDRSVFDSSALEAKYTSLERKLVLFGSGALPHGLFKVGLYGDLVGQRVDAIGVRGKSEIEVALNLPVLSTDLDPKAYFIPAHITGAVRSGWNGGAPLHLAVAINGTIQATTQTYTFPVAGQKRGWSAVVDEASFQAGSNNVEVFVITSVDGKRVLEHAGKLIDSASRRRRSFGARKVLEIEESGFHNPESWDGIPVRWTDGKAKLIVPLDEQNPLKALRVDLASSGPNGTTLKVLVDGEEIFDGSIPAGRWSKTFSLVGRPLKNQVTIELISDTFVPRKTIKNSPDTRTLGVAVEAITLLEDDQSLSGKPLSEKGYRSQLSLVKNSEDRPLTLGENATLIVRVRNKGADPWPTMHDVGQPGGVRLGILWFAPDRTDKHLAEQRAELPRTLSPGNEAEIQLALNPIGYDRKRLSAGDYEVWVGLVQEGVT
jgi:hypothetical protein